MALSKRAAERMVQGLRRLVPIIQQQRVRDVSEADTVTLVKDVLHDVLGYDKYAELTGEMAIRGTYSDLAIKLDDKVVALIEVKAIGLTLNDRHLKQTVDYAANLGVEWVILTNAATWHLYQVIFGKPIERRLLLDVDLTSTDWRRSSNLDLLAVLSKEGYQKGAHIQLRDRQDATSRFIVAATVLHNQAVRAVIRRELRRVVDVLVPDEDITHILESEVLKRDALEGPNAAEAAKRVKKALTRPKRLERKSSAEVPDDPEVEAETDGMESGPSNNDG